MLSADLQSIADKMKAMAADWEAGRHTPLELSILAEEVHFAGRIVNHLENVLHAKTKAMEKSHVE